MFYNKKKTCFVAFPFWLGPRAPCCGAAGAAAAQLRARGPWSCTRAPRCCWAAPMRWAPSGTSAPRTLPRGCGWGWSCAAPRARTTARWGRGATSAAGWTTACWCAPAGSPTAASTAPGWWMTSAEPHAPRGRRISKHKGTPAQNANLFWDL